MSYQVQLTPPAEKDLRGLPQEMQRRVVRWLQRLTDQLRPPGIVPVKGQPRGNYRGRVGRCRIGYEVNDQIRQVWVWEIEDRGRFYDIGQRRR